MKITEHHTVTLEIDGVEKVISLADAQALYDSLGGVSGVRRHGGTTVINPVYPRPYVYPSYPYWSYTGPINANAIATNNTSSTGNVSSIKLLQAAAE